jgi:hypothetical protein
MTACKQKVDFIISNEDKTPHDLQVVFGGDTIFKGLSRYTDVRPDLSNYISKSFPKGKYVIDVLADSGKIHLTKPIDLSKDCWVFIKHSLDSVTIHSTREEPVFY